MADDRLPRHRGSSDAGNAERLPARGTRGETCIVVQIQTGSSPESGAIGAVKYTLASGERLAGTDDPRTFQTLDGKRRFTLI
jgi:hypothetical protein